jgi:hypothetical protein
MNGIKRRGFIRSKSSARRKLEFHELERKSLIGVIAGAIFVVVVATLAVYFGINVHEP